MGSRVFDNARSPQSPLEGPINRTSEAEGREGIGSGGAEYPESVPTSLRLASLAVHWHTQEKELRVRQREELRRALSRVAKMRTWIASEAPPLTSMIRDVEDFTDTGLRLMQRDLQDELAEKRIEVTRLREMAADLRELAGVKEWGDPVEVVYSHTVRKPEGLATRTETLTLAGTGEAEDAAAAFEKKLAGWEKLRSKMQDDLERRQRQLREVGKTVSAFAVFSTGVVSEILSII